MLLNIISISLGAILINNFIFSQFLGCCPFLGCSNKTDTAFGMGVAVIFVMGMASAICWLIDTYILVPLGLAFLETLAFILIIAALVQLVEMFLKKSVPALYSALGIYLPLITTNCAVLGVTILNIDEGYTFIQSIMNAFGSGVGFLLAMFLFAGVRSKIEDNDYPESFKGIASTLVAASILSVSFMGFSGMIDNIFGM